MWNLKKEPCEKWTKKRKRRVACAKRTENRPSEFRAWGIGVTFVRPQNKAHVVIHTESHPCKIWSPSHSIPCPGWHGLSLSESWFFGLFILWTKYPSLHMHACILGGQKCDQGAVVGWWNPVLAVLVLAMVVVVADHSFGKSSRGMRSSIIVRFDLSLLGDRPWVGLIVLSPCSCAFDAVCPSLRFALSLSLSLSQNLTALPFPVPCPSSHTLCSKASHSFIHHSLSHTHTHSLFLPSPPPSIAYFRAVYLVDCSARAYILTGIQDCSPSLIPPPTSIYPSIHPYLPPSPSHPFKKKQRCHA